MKSSAKLWSRWILIAFFILAGTNHFLNPKPYLAMMPAYLPWPAGLVAWSGVAEFLGGLGVLVPALRGFAGWGLIALLVAVFPANLNAALHGWPGYPIPPWILWARLPLQPVLIWWVYRVCFRDGPATSRPAAK